MEIAILTHVESLMNQIAKMYAGDGLLGFAVGEKFERDDKARFFIRDVYKTDVYLEILEGVPPWNKLKEFLTKNQEYGEIFPWLMKRGGYVGIDEWIENFRDLTNNKNSIISIPWLSSTEFYDPRRGIVPIKFVNILPEGFGLFSNEFMSLYAKTKKQNLKTASRISNYL